MDVQFICLRKKQLNASLPQSPSFPRIEDLAKRKKNDKSLAVSAELCAACKLIISSFYNSPKNGHINLTRGHKSCHLKYSIDNTLQVGNFDMVIRDPYKLPNKSVYFHLNEEILCQPASSSSAAGHQFNYSDKTVLLVGCGGIKRLPVVKSLAKLSFKKLVCLNKERSWAHSYFDDWIYAENEDVNQKETTLKAITSYCEANRVKFDAVLTYDDYCVLTTSYIQKELNVPGATPYDFLEKIKNKHEFRNMSRKLGISCPKFFLIKNEEVDAYYRVNKLRAELALNDAAAASGQPKTKEFVSLLDESLEPVQIEFPLIIKNIFGSGKDFVKKCNSTSDFCDTLIYLKENQYKIDLIVEQFFEGHEIDLDILIQDNQMKFLALSDNLPPLEPWFYEQGGILPSIYLSQTEKKAIETIVAKWISKMNFQSAVLHFEARCRPASIYESNVNTFRILDENNNYIVDENAYYRFLIENESSFIMPIEINPRLGGAEAWSMSLAAHDVNMMTEYVNICLGLPLNKDELIRKQNHPRNQCISKDFHPAVNTKLNSIQVYLEQLKQNPSAVEINIFRSPGDTLSFKDYVGFITVVCNAYDPKATAASLDELLEKRQKILDLVKFELTDTNNEV